MRNLVSNAIKFTPNGGKIRIESKAVVEDGIPYIQVAVSDTGIGIAVENQDKLFKLDDKFVMSGTAGEKGTGLGLILCKELIHKNGGRIWVESKPEQGSKFVFIIPRQNFE